MRPRDGRMAGSCRGSNQTRNCGLSPFLISLGMVAGVFVACWTIPMLLKGNSYIWRDFREKPHLIVWAILAGMLWAVANTLTVFAIRNIGLSIAFPLWNTNSLVGLFGGWLLFNELRGAGFRQWLKVLSIPYRKAYISGMNPLSFVTVFTFGELSTTFALALIFQGGLQNVLTDFGKARPALFWLFLGGFCWVLGDLFQQYVAKYIGIGRGIPLSNTKQLWGLAWGALVFGELTGLGLGSKCLIVAGSLVMVGGAAVISFAEAPESEQASWKKAMERECHRYGLQPGRVAAILEGDDPVSRESPARSRWEWLVVAAALGIFVWLGAPRDTSAHPV